MFDIGFAEIFLLAVVGLLVLGPERLPRVARSIGALLRRARSSWNSLQVSLEAELDARELKQPLEDARKELEQARRDLDQAAQQMDAAARTEQKPDRND